MVAISEHYNAVLADTLTRTFGVEWERRERGRDRTRALEVSGVPEELVSEFSSRSRAIGIETDRLFEKYVADHERRHSKKVIVDLGAEATFSAREEKCSCTSLSRIAATMAVAWPHWNSRTSTIY